MAMKRKKVDQEESGKTRQIRVSEEVFKAIQDRGTPIVDSCDDILRRIFGLPKREG